MRGSEGFGGQDHDLPEHTYGLGTPKRVTDAKQVSQVGPTVIKPGLTEGSDGRWAYDPVKGGTHPQQHTRINPHQVGDDEG